MFTLREISKATGGKVLKGCPDLKLVGLSIDSRKIKNGEFFIAIKGARFDGHDFINEAVERGAPAVMVSDRNKIPERVQAAIQVRDTIDALHRLANFHRNKFDIPIMGVTGSNGKTTVKEMIWALLSAKYKNKDGESRVLKNIGTENNHIGVPMTLLQLRDFHKAAVLEIGMNHPGEIRKLSSIIRPTIGVITNVGPSHLEFLGSLEKVFAAKAELLDGLEAKAVLVINGDDPFLVTLKKKKKIKIVTFGMSEGCNFKATEITREGARCRFILNKRYKFDLGLLGNHNVYNAAASMAAARILGTGYKTAQKALEKFEPPYSRCCIKKIKDIIFIDDTYNSNPLSVRCALAILRDYPAKGRKIYVAGDMLELGERASAFHYEIGEEAVRKAGIQLLLSIGSLGRKMCEGAVAAGLEKEKVVNVSSHAEAAEFLKGAVRSGDVILIKGSRAMQMERIFELYSKARSGD